MDHLIQIINEWDPIDVFPMAPKDEYTREIQQISRFIEGHKAITVEELTTAIRNIFTAAFGTDIFVYEEEDCQRVALKILNTVK